MSVAIAQMPVKLDKGKLEFSARINSPGIVRGLSFALVERPVVSFLAAKQGKVEVDEVPLLFIELDPEGEKVERHFVLLPSDTPFTPKDGRRCTWLATGHSQRTGTILHLFEVSEVAS